MLGPVLPVVIAGTLAAGILRTTIGFGAGVFLTASFSLALPPKFLLAVMAFLQIALDLSAGYYYWGRWDRRLILAITPASMVGVGVGGYLVAVLPSSWIRRVIGVSLGAYACAQLFLGGAQGLAVRKPRPWHGIALGVLAGLASSLANVHGLVLATYLISLQIPRETFVGSLVAIQFFQDLFKIYAYWQFEVLGLPELLYALPFVPLIFVGGWIGSLISPWIPPAFFTRLVLFFILLSSARLLL